MRTVPSTEMDLRVIDWHMETVEHLRALLDVITRQGGYLRDEDLIAVQHARHHLERKP